MRTKFSLRILAALWLASIGIPSVLNAAPIYVIREKGGVVRFTSKPPAPGIKAEVFTAKGSGFSTYKVGAYPYRAKLQPNIFESYIQEASSRYGVDAALIRAVIHAESGFNPQAISHKGARGLMQLMPGTARMHGVTRILEPRQNILAGTRHLAGLIRRYNGNLTNTLAAYNAGEGAVEQFGGVPPYSETKEYVRKVLALQTRYRAVS